MGQGLEFIGFRRAKLRFFLPVCVKSELSWTASSSFATMSRTNNAHGGPPSSHPTPGT